MDDNEVLEEKKKRFIDSFFGKNKLYSYGIFLIIVFIGYFIRVRNLKNLAGGINGQYASLGADSFLFLRYAKEVLADGSLAAVDMMRYFPTGYEQIGEFNLLSHVIVWLYKFLHLFNSNVTLEFAHAIYPVIFFSLSLVFFFFLVSRLLNEKVALLATAFLVVIPSYLQRTISGFSDKESLAMFFMFGAMYFFVRAWQEKNLKESILFALLSGLTTGLMGLTWGGVNFLFLIFGTFVLIQIFLDRFIERDFYIYLSWFIPMVLLLSIFYPARYNFLNAIFGLKVIDASTAIIFFTLFVGFIHAILINKKNLFKIKDKIQNKFPLGAFSILVSLLFGILMVLIFGGVGRIISTIKMSLILLTSPVTNRWILTVRENQQPFLVDWIYQWGWIYVMLILLGSIFLVYNMLKDTKLKWKGTVFYSIFIFMFVFARYKRDSVLDGEGTLSMIFYLGSLIGLFLAIVFIYFYSYKKDKSLHNSLYYLNNGPIFLLLYFLIMLVAARNSIRLIFVFSPVTTILVAFAFIYMFDLAKKIEGKYFRYAFCGVLLLVLLFPFIHGSLFNFYIKSVDLATNTKPDYNSQWQEGMRWVRENTDKDAVFAHWWDYGYWVQTGGERATITDGGNAGGYALNHFMGRHVLTAQNETEALEYLYAKNATHLLMFRDDVNIYPAYSSIGSDVNYDRYTRIGIFQVDPKQTLERRDDFLYSYTGAFALDEDFIYGNKLFPALKSRVIGIGFPVSIYEEGKHGIKQPKVIIFYQGQQTAVPLKCIFINGKEILYDNDGLDGCFMPIYMYDGKKSDPLKVGFYLSAKVRKTLFAHLFLYAEESKNFKLVYSDQKSDIPFAMYGGSLAGPLKIWEIHYPEGLEPSEYYYKNELSDPSVMGI